MSCRHPVLGNQVRAVAQPLVPLLGNAARAEGGSRRKQSDEAEDDPDSRERITGDGGALQLPDLQFAAEETSSPMAWPQVGNKEKVTRIAK